MRYLYSGLLYFLAPFLPIYLYKRARKNSDYSLHWCERFGFNLKNDSDRPIIWLHAVSVGETRAISKIVELLTKNYPQYQILITQMTPTGRATARSLYPQAMLHYIPYDLPHAVINFYKTFKPQLGIIMETEIWPNLIHYAKQYNIPLFLANARLSNKSFKSYYVGKFFITPILNQLTSILCQDTTTFENFNKLGVEHNNLQVVEAQNLIYRKIRSHMNYPNF
jgi:3-deoxy-D-manno-octulosonic-acid transferase